MPIRMRSRTRRDPSRDAVVLDEVADGFGSIHDITGTDGLMCFGESAQRFWIGLDLLGFAQGKVGLDGVGDFLLHAAVVFRCSGTQGRI